jgi:hypothetical protein
MSFTIGYVELENRITNQLYDRVTLAIDIISQETAPPLNDNCYDCNFFKKQLALNI